MFAINDQSLETGMTGSCTNCHLLTGNMLQQVKQSNHLEQSPVIFINVDYHPPIGFIHVIACHRLEYVVVHKNTATQSTLQLREPLHPQSGNVW